MFHGTAVAQQHLDSRLVVPADVSIQDSEEFVDGRRQPVARAKKVVLQAAEEAFACRVVWQASFARHGLDKLRIGDPGQPITPSIGTAAFGVYDQPVAIGGNGLDCGIEHWTGRCVFCSIPMALRDIRRPRQTSLTQSFAGSHVGSLLLIARLNIARFRIRSTSCSYTRINQMSLSLRGAFWPTIILFQGLPPLGDSALKSATLGKFGQVTQHL